jgi:hypothetical protein
MRLTGITGIFDTQVDAELYAEIQPDLNGVPAAGAALARSSLVLSASTLVSLKWAYIRLDPVVSLEAGQRYWMVLKGIRGEISVALKAREEEPFGEILMNRGGQMWKRLGWAHSPVRLFQLDPGAQVWLVEGQVSQELLQVFKANQLTLSASATANRSRDGWQVTDSTAQRVYRIRPQQGSLEVCEPTLVGVLRLVYLPEIDNQTAAVEIRLEGLGRFQKIDPHPEAQSLNLPISDWRGQPLILEVRSHAQGTVSIANVIHEYRQQESKGRT